MIESGAMKLLLDWSADREIEVLLSTPISEGEGVVLGREFINYLIEEGEWGDGLSFTIREVRD